MEVPDYEVGGAESRRDFANKRSATLENEDEREISKDWKLTNCSRAAVEPVDPASAYRP
jgi:hypothetical protein